MIKPVFANSAWVRTRDRLILKGAPFAPVDLPVRYGLLHHPTAGIVLIDTGYTPHALSAPNRSLALRSYSRLLGPKLRDEGQPEAVLARFGLTPADVGTVIVTHCHVDHLSGLPLFAHAQVLTRADVWHATTQRPTLANLRHGCFAELLPPSSTAKLRDIADCPRKPAGAHLGDGADLFGDGSVLAVDLPGHAEGHFGLLFPHLPAPLLYAVDAQWRLPAVTEGRVPGYPSALIAHDVTALQSTAARVARFHAAGGDVMLCHDPAPQPYDLDAGAGL